MGCVEFDVADKLRSSWFNTVVRARAHPGAPGVGGCSFATHQDSAGPALQFWLDSPQQDFTAPVIGLHPNVPAPLPHL